MSSHKPRIDSPIARFARWWTRLRLPRAPRVLEFAGVWNARLWDGEPTRTCRGRWHGYRLRLDTNDFHQRGAYFYGRLLDVHAQLCMLLALRPGDTFLDGGANIGLLSMLAAYAVGPAGHVIAVEPNPDIYERLQWHLTENRLGHVLPHCLALSDRDGVMRLTVPPTGNTGAATLGALPARHGGCIGAVYDVPIRTGDEVVGALPDAPLLIKLDVEGHEPAALRGLTRTIQTHRPAIILECNTEMLPQNGASVAELFGLLAGWGYRTFALTTTWSRWRRDWRLHIHPMDPSWRPGRTENILFLKPGGVHEARLAPHMHSLSRAG